MFSPPTGTITFLFTDIEGSTRLWERCPEAMRLALARHDALLREAIERHNGYVFKTVGDAFCAAFYTAPEALNAAQDAHLALQQERWGETGLIRVRMGLHTGEAEERDNDYFGQTLNRVARLQGIGHGQQTLISQSTQALIKNVLPAGITLKDMGLHRLKDLQDPEPVFQLCHPHLPQEFPPLNSLNNLPTNLPRQPNMFIGRQAEMQAIRQLLDAAPLVTLTGSGGCGKTRLALQVGAEVLENYKDGVWLVELGALSDPGLISQTIAVTFGLREEPGRFISQTLTDYLQPRKLLLLLDNCEHVLSECATLLETLLKACPALSVLATSREPFNLAAERPWRVPSLLQPDPQRLPHEEERLPRILLGYDAIRLFVERATVQRADFALTRHNASAVAEVCQRLDGIPLALELAAARVKVLSVEQIATRLDDRFRLLIGGNRTALPRHQTLRALMDWSYDLLRESEKALLQCLSVFAEGWTLEAAEVVCSRESLETWEVLDLLMALVDKSLVIYEESGGKACYRMLETVRQYAAELLAASEPTNHFHRMHRNYFLHLAEQAEEHLSGPEQAQWLEMLESEHKNLRKALQFCLEDADGTEAGLRMGAALQQFWWTRGHLSEGRSLLSTLLSLPDANRFAEAQANALNGLGALARMQGDYRAAQPMLEKSLTIRRELGDKCGIAASLGNLGLLAREQADYSLARTLLEDSLVLYQELHHKPGIALSLGNLGQVLHAQGDYTAPRFLQESLSIHRELENRQGMALSLNNLGEIAQDEGDYPAAQALYQKSLAIRRELGDRWGVAASLCNLALVSREQGNSVTARALDEESLAIRREIGDKWGIAFSLNNLGNIAQDEGEHPAAQAFHQESLVLYRELRNTQGIAIALCNLGIVANEQGDYSAAHTHLVECISLCHVIAEKWVSTHALECFAALSCRQQRNTRAVRLYGAAQALRDTLGYPLRSQAQERQDHSLAALRVVLGEDAYAIAEAAGKAMTFEQAIEYALDSSDTIS